MRVKRGVTAHKRHNKIRRATKGMSHPRRASTRLGRQGVVKALQYSYRDRRNKKRTLRALWNTRINAAARLHGMPYSLFINGLKKTGITLDRKILSELAVNEPTSFEAVVKAISKN
ncbi:MAG: 50S ribosomal protein L20 [Patescibacteria group bacterium]